MSRWITPDQRAEWRGLFTSYERSAYRLEGQQIYCSPSEDAALADFLCGRPIGMDWTYLRETTSLQRSKGCTKTKVRVAVEPWTQYTHLELTQYPTMAEIGEDIHIIAVQQGDWPEGVPHHDYWLFDERDLWLMHYHENFYFKGAELIEDEAVVAEHLRARDAAMATAIPLVEYLALHPELEESTTA